MDAMWITSRRQPRLWNRHAMSDMGSKAPVSSGFCPESSSKWGHGVCL